MGAKVGAIRISYIYEGYMYIFIMQHANEFGNNYERT